MKRFISQHWITLALAMVCLTLSYLIGCSARRYASETGAIPNFDNAPDFSLQLTPAHREKGWAYKDRDGGGVIDLNADGPGANTGISMGRGRGSGVGANITQFDRQETALLEEARNLETKAALDRTIEELTRTASRLAQQNDLARARDVYAQIVALDPTNAQAKNGKESIERIIGARPIPAPLPEATIIPKGLPPKKIVDREEVWVIARKEPDKQPMVDIQGPGTGALLAKKSATEMVPVPLKHTDVNATITGYIATTWVKQQYHNPFDAKIEAVYVFPLPQDAAVNEFIMTIGDRKIRGIIREREEARRVYEEARNQGYVASLLEQQRPNIFTQSVANIEPGKEIDIDIKYFNALQYVDGYYEYVFPMVVGPRFNPPGWNDPITPVAHPAKEPVAKTGTNISYLKPNQRSGHDISLSVQVNAGVILEQVSSSNHAIEVQWGDSKPTAVPAQQPIITPAGSFASDPNKIPWTVRLAQSDSIPNKDFVLRYKVSGKTIKSAVMTQRDQRGGFFTLMLYPPEDLRELKRSPLEMVFTLDVSGSMSGEPIEQSKAAIRYALKHMDERDTFQIIRFAGGASQFSARPVRVTQQSIRHALQFIESTDAGGGTYMIQGIRASLNFPHDEHRLRFVSFLTDGYIGNESEILAEVHKSLGPSRIFSFGVGSSTNRYLLDHMAKLGNGAVAYLGLNDKADEVMQLFFDRVSHPAMTDVSVDFGGMKVEELYPQRIPDLFAGRPVIVTGRFTGNAKSVKLKGNIGGEMREFEIPVNLDDSPHAGIASVWARAKIADIADRSTWEPSENWPGMIKQTALEYGLMSQYTSFLAVDSSTRTAGAEGTTLAVPVPVPDGVKYETTVQEK